MKIRMAHGSGGEETRRLVEEIFVAAFGNDRLRAMEDAAVVKLKGKTAFTTDSYVVTPLFFRGGDIGRLSVCGTVNDLLMMGAKPEYLTAGFIIEEGMDTGTLEKIALSMAEAAKESGAAIVAGDTKVIEGRGGLFINTSGIGTVPEERDISARNCAPGDAIILSGTLGDHHACILSARMGIENSIRSDTAPLCEPVGALLHSGAKVKAMRDITRGGLGTVLNEVCGAAGAGAQIYEDRIPVTAQVKSFCEILGLDPMYMGNEGKFIAVVGKDDADKALAALRETRGGKNASHIGNVCEGKAVTMITAVGGRRTIHTMTGEGLPRIC